MYWRAPFWAPPCACLPLACWHSGVGTELSLVARWLMAWGDGTLTGMVCAVFVAFKPEWLATWSDTLYLHGPPPPAPPAPPPQPPPF